MNEWMNEWMKSSIQICIVRVGIVEKGQGQRSEVKVTATLNTLFCCGGMHFYCMASSIACSYSVHNRHFDKLPRRPCVEIYTLRRSCMELCVPVENVWHLPSAKSADINQRAQFCILRANSMERYMPWSLHDVRSLLNIFELDMKTLLRTIMHRPGYFSVYTNSDTNCVSLKVICVS